MQEGISAIFEQAGCGTPAVHSLLGEAGVSEGNMMQYLGILEQRTNEILQVCLALCCGIPLQQGAGANRRAGGGGGRREEGRGQHDAVLAHQ